MKLSISLPVIASLLLLYGGMGQQTLIQTNFTADPAPMVDNDTIYLYTSHDEDYAEGFQMHNRLLHEMFRREGKPYVHSERRSVHARGFGT